MSDISKNILKGAKESLEYAKGNKVTVKEHKVRVPEEVDVVAIRNKLHMEREEFADEFGFSLRTLEKWERGERSPKGPTRAYLTVIEKDPKAVKRALSR